MPPPPAKRRKRLIVHDSDDEGSNVAQQSESKPGPRKPSVLETKTRLAGQKGPAVTSISTRTRTKRKAVAEEPQLNRSRWSPPSSPENLPSKPKQTQNSQTIGSLHSFFSSANTTARVSRETRTKAPQPLVEEGDEQEDVIEDDSPDEKLPKTSASQGIMKLLLDRRKPLQEQTQSKAVAASQERPTTASQRFLSTGESAAKDTSTQTTSAVKHVDTRPWAERYGPTSLEELVVHKKKVADVRGWLDDAYLGRNRKRLLILRGPAGAGKTATLSALAQVMGLELSEWRNPVDSSFSSEAYISMSAQFEDFLGRSGRFGTLNFSPVSPKPREPGHIPSTVNDKARKAIVMEEFPNTFMSTSQALRTFRSNVLQYLFANTPTHGLPLQNKLEGQTSCRPLIMIITETSTDGAISSSDSFTAHRLLGPEILNHPGTSIVDFNPVAPTLLAKALELVIQKEARQSGRRRIPGPSVLKKLGEVGDIRSAISSLEFLCLRGGDGDDWGGRVANKSKKGAHSALTKMEKASLELLSQREASLGLFHAVGKVVYNKREEPPPANRPSQPPDHLPQHARLKTSEVSVDTLMDETGTDPRTFIAALHENYVLSCESDDFTDTLNGCIDAISDSDMLIPGRAGFSSSSRGPYQGTATDALRQDEIAFQTAVRGLLFALPYPVKRASHPVKGAGKNDAHKMFYPTSMRLGRQMEEIEALVEGWSHRSRTVPMSDTTSDESLFVTRTHSTSAELVPERLPYLAKIQRSHAHGSLSADLEKITQFNGIHVSTDEQVEEDDLVMNARRDKAMMPPPRLPLRGGKESQEVKKPVDEDIGKLYLSDDDIEDN